MLAQQTKPQESAEKSPELPAQIELLETHIRFESNGDSRKEVHTRIHINNELGARQFARLSFDYNRSFQQIEFPLVRITHQGGGTADILPSAISDQPNPAVVNAPAYQDVRVKSVRILGLAPDDLLEYRVVTTTSHHPLAPDFWLDHTFDRSGVVSREIFELSLPASRAADAEPIESSTPETLTEISSNAGRARLRTKPQTPAPSMETIGQGDASQTVYRWNVAAGDLSQKSENPDPSSNEPDIVVSTFTSWRNLGAHLEDFVPPMFVKEFYELQRTHPGQGPMEAVYAFVSQKIRTIDLPLGATGFRLRDPGEVLSSGYGTPEDKVFLFRSLSRVTHKSVYALFVGAPAASRTGIPNPSVFKNILIEIPQAQGTVCLDLGLEVAPFGLIPADFRGKIAFRLQELLSTEETKWWTHVPDTLPLRAFQRVYVDAGIGADGTLAAKVKYSMRGDNELVLRLAFHQSPKDKWKEVAGLLALSDGFRGRITNVTASDPYATEKPFSVGYEISQPKFVDWSKKPVRIPALLPQLGLPDPPTKPATGAATYAVDLGTPLDVETHLTLHLPPGTSAHPPVGNAVVRDYATFASKYSAAASTLTASRHLNFLERQIPADRAPDYNAFVRAVHSDESQEFVLDRSEPAAAQPTTQNSKRKN